MRFCITDMRYMGFRALPWYRIWYRYEYANWHHCTRPTGLIVHWRYWQFHLVWDQGRAW